jgi:membrane-bound serine protease (ClpP class)
MSVFNAYLLCILLGLLFFGIELFVPGGILGAIGAVFLLAAIALGFQESAFGSQGGVFSAVLILAGLVAYIMLVLRLFPKTFFGRRMTLASDMSLSKASDDSEADLLGQMGTAHSDLRPSGIAVFGKRRIDVIADGSFVARGTSVKVIRVEGSRVLVRIVDQPA